MTKLRFAFIVSTLLLTGRAVIAGPVGPPTPIGPSTGTTGGWVYDAASSSSYKTLGKVGIGTSSPSYLLHITSGAGTTNTLMSVSTGGINLFSVSGSSVNVKVPIYLPDGTILLSTTQFAGGGGASTGPYTQNPATAAQNMNGFDLTNVQYYTGSTMTLTGASFSVGTATFSIVAGNVGIGVSAPGGKLDVAGSLQHVYFANNGYLGVNQIAPAYPLDITGNQRVAGVLSANAFQNGGSTNIAGVGIANSSGTTFTQNVYGTAASTTAFQNAAVGEFSGTTYQWTYSGSGTPFMTWKSGSVGIGNTNPASPLDIDGPSAFGNIIVRGDAGVPSGIRFLDDSNTSRLVAFSATGNTQYMVGVTTGDGGLVVISTVNKGFLGAGQSNAGGPSLTWETIGTDVRVGIGTTSPSYRLHVATGAGVSASTTLFAVSTGAVNVFSVLGGSVNLKVPLVWPDGTRQSSAGVGSPGGSATQMQFNNSGAFGGATDVTYSPTTGVTASTITVSSLTITGTISGSGTNGFLYTNPTVSTAAFLLGTSTLTLSGSSIATGEATLNLGNASSPTAFQVSATSVTVPGSLCISSVGFSMRYLSAFDSMYMEAPANKGWLFSPDSRLSMANDSSATTGVGGTMLNFAYNKNWTIDESSNGIAGQVGFMSMAGMFSWALHANMTGIGAIGYVAGVHNTNQTGFAVTVTSTKSYGFQGYVTTTTDNDFMAFHPNVTALNYLWPNLQGTPTVTGNYTGKWINLYSPTSPLLSVGSWDYLGNIIAATETLTGSSFSVGGGTFVVKNGLVGIGTTNPTQQISAIALPGQSITQTWVSSDAVVTANLTVSKLAGGFLSFGTNSSHALVFQTGNTTRLTIGTSGGLTVGSPTGGDKGTGTINVATDIYKNNTAYANPDYVAEKYYTGRIVQFAGNSGAKDYPGILSLDSVETYMKKNYQLPRVATFQGRRRITGVFSRQDILLEKLEEAYIYIFQLNERLKALEAKQK